MTTPSHPPVIFLSTSIPYVNAKPHIGYAFELVQADILARLYRQLGAHVYFTTGSDENALKNVESAEKNGMPVQEFVDANAQQFTTLTAALDIQADTFIRTSSPEHKQGAQALWERCAHDIYKKTYVGLYCVGCETFYDDGEFAGNICPHHNRPLERVEEENYFFALSRYQSAIETLLASDTLRIAPSYRKEELLNFVRKGLRDFSVSRPKTRVKGWGVPVASDPSQHMYVWFDALSNYITALGFGSNDTSRYVSYWEQADKRIHVIGKDIIKFHGIYWPAMLMSANLPLPTDLYTHGFITTNNQKMSKTLGNVVDPHAVIKTFGLSATRYYLAREIPMHDDGDYSESRMQQLYTADLANELGNLLSRVTTLAAQDHITLTTLTHLRIDLSVEDIMDYHHYIVRIWEQVKQLNKQINTFEPWTKPADERKDFLIEAAETVRQIGVQLQPILPDVSEIIITHLNGEVRKIPPVFPRKTLSPAT